MKSQTLLSMFMIQFTRAKRERDREKTGKWSNFIWPGCCAFCEMNNVHKLQDAICRWSNVVSLVTCYHEIFKMLHVCIESVIYICTTNADILVPSEVAQFIRFTVAVHSIIN